MIRRILLCSLMFSSLSAQNASTLGPHPPVEGLRKARLYLVASGRVFTVINRNDAIASMKALVEIIGRERGFLLDSKIDILDDVSEIRKRLESLSVDLLILDVVDYFQLAGSGLLKPILACSLHGENGTYSYLLLVSDSAGGAALADLRGKNISVFSRTGGDVGMAWIDVLLAEQHLGRVKTYFGPVNKATTASACVHPLFFGKNAACVVDEIGFDILKEMNPQLGRLRVLAKSPPLLESIVAIPVYPHPYQEELTEALRQLHTTPRGEQILTVFKTERLVSIGAATLETTSDLWTRYHQLANFPDSVSPGQAARSAGQEVSAPKLRPVEGNMRKD